MTNSRNVRRPKGPTLRPRWLVRCFLVSCLFAAVQASAGGSGAIRIERLAPEQRGGYVVKVTYGVDVEPAEYWRFKTDFDNPRLEENPNILSHRVIQQTKDRVITENRYAWAPDKRFRWMTIVDQRAQKLFFSLMNTKETGYDYYDGVIQIGERENRTEVIQTLRFQFPGAWLWVHLPGRSGMAGVLRAFAEWEQRAIPQRSVNKR